VETFITSIHALQPSFIYALQPSSFIYALCIIPSRLVVEQGLTMVHPFDDPLVIAGQGTIAMEIMKVFVVL
jgi:hypothetical protein